MNSEPKAMSIAEFLLLRFDEDEAVARRATHRKIAGPSHGHWRPDSAALMANPITDQADREHIARWDPERVLAEVEAKRRIVERCSAVDYGMPSTHLAHGILALVALPYADHPDFNPDWRP